MGNNNLEIEKRQLYKFSDSNGVKRDFGYLSIPKYQRRYSWKQNQIESFVSEMKIHSETLKKKFPPFKEKNEMKKPLTSIFGEYAYEFLSPCIYFGNVVIATSDSNGFPAEIVDGQQRITTFSLTLKILSLYKDKIKSSSVYKSDKDAFSSLFTVMDMLLNYLDKSDMSKKSFVSSENRIDGPYLKEALKIENKESIRIKTNNTYIKNMFWINEEIKDMESDNLLFFLLSILTTEFGIVSFEGIERAYELFEALNSKGLQLSPSDLIKNLVFKLLHGKKVDPEKIWNEFIDGFKKETDADTKLPSSGVTTAFIRSYLMAHKREYIVKTKLFSSIKKTYSSDSIIKFIKNLSEMNKKFKNIISGIWIDGTKIKDQYINALYFSKLPIIYHSLSMYFLSTEGIEKDTFLKINEYLFKQSFLHWSVNNLASKELDQKVINVMIKVNAIEGIKSWVDIKDILNFEILKETFGTYSYKDRMETIGKIDFDSRKNLLTMYKVIRNYRTKNNETNDIFDDNNIDLEHLLPKKPSKDWFATNKFKDQADADGYIKKIGNTLFINGTINKSIGNISFEKKLTDKTFSKIKDSKKSMSLYESKLFIEEMEWAFEKVPKIWDKNSIDKRTKKISNYLVKKGIFNPELIN